MTLTRAMHRRARELRARGAASESGFSIVEVMIAIFLLLVGILGALLMVNTANSTTFANNARTSGVNLAREVADGARAVNGEVSYEQLSDGCPSPSSPANPCSTTSAIVAGLQAQPGLEADASSPAGTWNIKRAGITYTVEVSVCSMDDPSDGYGSHSAGGPYCSDVASSGTADSDADDYKRVVVDVRWGGTRDSANARAVTLISSGGVNGPSVTCLRPTGSSCPATPQITSTSINSQSFTATINGSATRLDWYVDGTYTGTVTPNNTTGTATFTWNIGPMSSQNRVQDGSYEISAIAYTASGLTGSTGSVQVLVNRQVPSAPSGYTAGRDTKIIGNGATGGVDLDWLPSSDRDVLYYRIYRQAGTATPVLLATTADESVTSYTDMTPPANPTNWYAGGGGKGSTAAVCPSPLPAASSSLYYYVVAVDQSGTSPREGTATAKIDVNLCNHAPKPLPTNTLQIVNNADGTLSLTGSLPASPMDPDSGDTVNALRVYRWTGGSNTTPSIPADRYEYLLLAGLTGFTDFNPRPNGVNQKYCITTVDTHMEESACSNVVTG